MSTNSISITDDIKQWFDIRRYAGVEAFSSGDWYINLLHRSLLRSSLFPIHFRDDCLDERHLRSVARIVRRAIYEGPLIAPPVPGTFVPLVANQNVVRINDATVGLTTLTVRPLLRSDLLNLDELYPVAKVRNIWQGLPDAAVDDTSIIEQRAADLTLLNTAIDDPDNTKTDQAHLVVDLRATDKQIRADFGKWLNQARRLYVLPNGKRRRRSITDEIPLRWKQCHTLAFLDIHCWARWKKRATIGIEWQRLFDPDGYAIEAKFPATETLFNVAVQAISPQFLETLLGDAIAESCGLLDQ